VKRAKLPDLHWHDLRHTFASWAVQRRVSLYELKELLGHSTLTMVKRYAHLAQSTCARPLLRSTACSRRPRSHRRARPTQQARSPQQGDSKLMVAVGYPLFCPHHTVRSISVSLWCDSVVSRPGLEPGTP